MGMTKRRKGIKKFNFDKNRKMKNRRAKEGLKIGCAPVKAAWDKGKSVKQNMKDMGLSSDPNISINALRSFKKKSVNEESVCGGRKKKKSRVIEELEAEAAVLQEVGLRLAEPEVLFCTYMMNKHGDDYKAMAKDRKNHYQDTPKQIKRRISTFKSIPAQYKEYLAQCQKVGGASGT